MPNSALTPRGESRPDWRILADLMRATGMKGIVITMQANPGFRHYRAGLGHSGFRELLDQLLVAAIAAGQSPREAQATIRSAQRKATQ